jgi:hypothetical protein
MRGHAVITPTELDLAIIAQIGGVLTTEPSPKKYPTDLINQTWCLKRGRPVIKKPERNRSGLFIAPR